MMEVRISFSENAPSLLVILSWNLCLYEIVKIVPISMLTYVYYDFSSHKHIFKKEYDIIYGLIAIPFTFLSSPTGIQVYVFL